MVLWLFYQTLRVWSFLSDSLLRPLGLVLWMELLQRYTFGNNSRLRPQASRAVAIDLQVEANNHLESYRSQSPPPQD
jgi:hypothetical protein